MDSQDVDRLRVKALSAYDKAIDAAAQAQIAVSLFDDEDPFVKDLTNLHEDMIAFARWVAEDFRRATGQDLHEGLCHVCGDPGPLETYGFGDWPHCPGCGTV